MKYLIAGNWKMNGSISDCRTLTEAVSNLINSGSELLDVCEFLVCPSFAHLSIVRRVLNHNNANVSLGAQDCSYFDDGAYTGDVSAAMLKDMGCKYVILGHSERRSYYQETSESVQKKAEKAHNQDLISIICVGENQEERDQGKEYEIVGEQLNDSLPTGSNAKNTIIAYEPVWAIGTGKTATPEDIAQMHQFIRNKLQEKLEDSVSMRILYGGSVKPENAKEIFSVENVNGGLIGGASLNADQFVGIAKAMS